MKFAQEWLKYKLDPWHRELLQTTELKVIVNASRQAGKSTIAAILILHRAFFRPRSTILIVCPVLRQSTELIKKVKGLLTMLPIQAQLKRESEELIEFENGSRVICLSGEDANIRSFSADLIIVDEASRVKHSVILALLPMTVATKGRMILLSTPWGKRGFFWETWMKGSSDWRRIKVTANESTVIDQDTFESHKSSMPEWFFRQEYHSEFLQRKDQLFSHDEVLNG